MNKRNLTREEIYLREQMIIAAVVVVVITIAAIIALCYSFLTCLPRDVEELTNPQEEVVVVVIEPTPVVEPELEPEPAPEPEEIVIPETISVTGENRDEITTMLAKTMYGEARGIKSVTEQACVAWTILNRVDDGQGTIKEVTTKKRQFYYRQDSLMIDDFGRDLKALAEDIILRWEREHAGETDVGRVLPKEYIYFHGKHGHNWFRVKYRDYSHPWDYSLESPYES